MAASGFNIAAVERETGLSKDVLRMWERRYGFPQPTRDSHGERSYPAEQVERLRLIKRLMDHGHRPGKLVATPVEQLSSLIPLRQRSDATEADMAETARYEEMLELIKAHDAGAYVQALQQRLMRLGLQRFVLDIVAPMTQRVGDAWETGRLEVFEEHLFTELTKRVLRQAIAALPVGDGSPKVLLTSVPEEHHILGLLMVEALFSLEGAECIPLGTQVPLLEIRRAAEAHRADVVALSFSDAFPSRQTAPLLQELRQLLPATVGLWAGGAGVSRVSGPSGVQLFSTLDQGVEALTVWQAQHSR